MTNIVILDHGLLVI